MPKTLQKHAATLACSRAASVTERKALVARHPHSQRTRVPLALKRAIVDRRAMSSAGGLLCGPLLRRLGPASLSELASLATGAIAVDPITVAKSLGWLTTDNTVLLDEFDALWAEVERRVRVSDLRYPACFASTRTAAMLLYLACRTARPSTVLETGVADGISTYVILRALELNQSGTLHSVDVRPDVGGLLRGTERGRWVLHLLTRNGRTALNHIFREVPPGELFFHDSNHSYYWQRMELKGAAQWIRPRGLIVCDDVDSSTAFLEWCRQHRSTPHLCFLGSRILGLVRFSGASGPAREEEHGP